MPVSEKHVQYEKMQPKWSLVRQIVDNDAKDLIRTVDEQDPCRSNQYKKDAILTNFTRLTKDGLTGLVFRRPASWKVPDELNYLIDDSTGFDYTIEQLAQQTIGEVLQTGRYGILVDCPADNQSKCKATFKPYSAESILNWRYEQIDGMYKLVMVVLQEMIDVRGSDKFDWVSEVQYRALLLEDGIYRQEIYNKDDILIGESQPLDYHGSPMTTIPFEFIGSENNDAEMDPIPLYDLAIINLGHYRNSADYEESIFITGQPFLVVNLGDMNDTEFKQANPGGIRFGSRAGLTLGSGGAAQLLQANSNQLAQIAMNDKKADAVAIGARLVAPPGGRETAEAARIRFGAQNASLYTVTKNTSLGLENCFSWAALFDMETPAESEFELNDQFYEEDADPNLIASEMMLFDRGLMTSKEIRMNLDKSGIQLGDVEPDPVDPMAGIDQDVVGTPATPTVVD